MYLLRRNTAGIGTGTDPTSKCWIRFFTIDILRSIGAFYAMIACDANDLYRTGVWASVDTQTPDT